MPPAPPRRMVVALKLLVLLGAPLAVLMSLWSVGVIYGARAWPHRVLDWETRYLGAAVTPEALQQALVREQAWAHRQSLAAASRAANEAAQPSTLRSDRTTSTAPSTSAVTSSAGVSTRADATASGAVPSELPANADHWATLATPPPLPDAHLRSALAQPRSIRLQLVVEPEVAAANPSWLAYGQSLVDLANRAYGPSTGVQFELRGAQMWPQRSVARDDKARRDELAPTVAADVDVVVVLTQEVLSSAPYFRDTFIDAQHGNHVVAGTVAGDSRPHAQGFLQALGRVLGARVLDDVSNAGPVSWMGPPITNLNAPIGLDDANRQRLLERKARPFARWDAPARGKVVEAAPDASVHDLDAGHDLDAP